MIIKWDDTFSVRVAEIDRQHKKLVDLLNQLHDAMMAGKGNEAIGKILDELANYTVYHFQTEEKYFDKFGYPETEAHKKEHADFVAKVSDFKAKFNQGKVALSMEVMRFLSDWVRNHIKGTDKKYADFFNRKGLF